ncbi:hypothetical protein Y032_0017g3285 [Ancylostoma ceylanicum]|uniref:Uncharacterized protein n=1 Tax=Ancylostoma ceylanicum TaxID=53326 RepID=A0A016V6F8_9BILA|nr:hypothetical protein Y032_0017g3285 [Ancylostoma ceylanicum]
MLLGPPIFHESQYWALVSLFSTKNQIRKDTREAQRFVTRCTSSDTVFDVDYESVFFICCGALYEVLQRFSYTELQRDFSRMSKASGSGVPQASFFTAKTEKNRWNSKRGTAQQVMGTDLESASETAYDSGHIIRIGWAPIVSFPRKYGVQELMAHPVFT